MKNILLTTVLLIQCLLSGSLLAQTEQAARFSLLEAQNYALENSYSMKGVEYELKVARKKVWETIADGLPQVNASADYNNNLNLPVSLLPAEFFGGEAGTYMPVRFGQKYSSSAALSASQLIFDGSYIVGTMATKVFVKLTKDQMEKTEIEIKDAVAQSYYLVLVAEANLKTIKENLEIMQKTLTETEAFYKNGFKEELDVDQVRLLLNQSENQLADAKRQIKVARTVLKFSMGMDIDSQLELSDNLEKFVDPIRLKKTETANYDVSNHIDFRMIETQLKAQKLIIRNEQSSYLPKISAFYNYGKNTSTNQSNVFDPEIPWFKSSMVGLKLTMPIFSSFQRSSKIKQEKLNYKKLQNQQLMTEQNLKKDITLSFTNLMSAKEKYENDVEGLEIAKRIYERTRIKFNEGISSSSELSQNEQQYLKSHATYISSTMELLKAKISFDKALGNL